MKFKALKVRLIDKQYISKVEECDVNDLPQNELLIKVHYSSVNFKDALSSIGNRGVTKEYPHTPGIDSVGTVLENKGTKFRTGDKVIVTGYDLGMNTWGGYSEYIRVPENWAVKLPDNLSEIDAMKWGTAGVTAVSSVYEMLNSNAHIPSNGKIIVSGATGGVGIISCLLLSKLGYRVTAITSKTDMKNFLTKNGIDNVISREDFLKDSDRPLLKGEYNGAIDVAGGEILDCILKKIDYKGAVTCCGLVSSSNLNTTVFPFILRGIRLIGINSAEHSLEYKEKLWDLISNEWTLHFPDEIIKKIYLSDLPKIFQLILKGNIFGRVIVKI